MNIAQRDSKSAHSSSVATVNATANVVTVENLSYNKIFLANKQTNQFEMVTVSNTTSDLIMLTQLYGVTYVLFNPPIFFNDNYVTDNPDYAIFYSLPFEIEGIIAVITYLTDVPAYLGMLYCEICDMTGAPLAADEVIPIDATSTEFPIATGQVATYILTNSLAANESFKIRFSQSGTQNNTGGSISGVIYAKIKNVA